MTNHYGPLASEFYQITKPIGDYYPDIEYYLHHLVANGAQKKKGRILEAAVGTGRLLIPLLQAGIKIEGVDSSQEMLSYCAQNARQAKVKSTLHCQDLRKLKLTGEAFNAIILSFGSFQIFSDLQEAKHVLKNFHNHLANGGKLYIDLDIPKLELDRAGLKVHGTIVDCADGSQILIEGSKTYNVVGQTEHIFMRYERWKKQKLQSTEIQQLSLRWYGVYEFQALLKETGFGDIQVCVDYNDEVIEPCDSNDTLCFIASKE